MENSIYRDAKGELLEIGTVVRVIGVLDLSGMSKECQAESVPVFRHLVGKYKRIEEFDEYGQVWLRFRIKKGAHAGYHWVGIEPWLLRMRRQRKVTAPPVS